MSENLEMSADRFITICGTLMEGVSHLCAELKTQNEAYVKGKAELDESLARLTETRANYIKDGSVKMDKAISEGLDELTSRIQKLLGDKQGAATVSTPAPKETTTDAGSSNPSTGEPPAEDENNH